MEQTYTFGSYIFYPDKGEIINTVVEGKPKRLGPQPSKLLSLLIDRYPSLVSHEEIKRHIWSEVQVDYDQSVHFCIRQIRAALNDRGSDPTFIKSIPRRGYQWLVPPGDPIRKPDQSNTLKAPLRRKYTRIIIYFLVFLGLVLLSKYLTSGKKDASTDAVRIAIMPFQPSDSNHTFFQNDIDLQLVDRLANLPDKKYEVIGPTTTENYPPSNLKILADELEVDCILNARYGTPNHPNKMLAEVIRPRDGRHVWVRYFSGSSNYQMIVDSIVGGVVANF